MNEVMKVNMDEYFAVVFRKIKMDDLFEDNFGYLSRYIFKEKINEEKKTGKYRFYK